MQATGAFAPTAVRAPQPKRVPAPKPSPFVLVSPPKKRGLQWHRLALLLGVAFTLLGGLAWGGLLLWQGAQQGLQQTLAALPASNASLGSVVSPHSSFALKAGSPSPWPSTSLSALQPTVAALAAGSLWPYAQVKPLPLWPLALTHSQARLQGALQALQQRYAASGLRPHVLVYNPGLGQYAALNPHAAVASASVIKLPLLYLYALHLNQGTLQAEQPLLLEARHKVEGSGNWQYLLAPSFAKRAFETAEAMIQSSDNSATQLMVEALGGVNKVNQQLAALGYTQTRVRGVLPDLEGTNTISPYEMVQTLVTLTNEPRLSEAVRSQMLDVLYGTHNRSLIPAGLPADTLVAHKTGNIGKALGEAAAITLPNGQVYYLAVQVERPYNSEAAATFIRELSALVYQHQWAAQPVKSPVPPVAYAAVEGVPMAPVAPQSSLAKPPAPPAFEVF
jgi:beta-lactamase class A